MLSQAPDTETIRRVATLLDAGVDVSRDDLADAARAVALTLKKRHPGRTIEVRVPPFAAVQVGATHGDGPTHSRGTPPNVVELDAATAVRLAAGSLAWDDAVVQGLIHYSGAHAADVRTMLPL